MSAPIDSAAVPVHRVFDASACLQVNPFEGDFGEPGDRVLKDKIVTARKGGACGMCLQDIVPGERIRVLAAIFSGALMHYRWCSSCCAAMAWCGTGRSVWNGGGRRGVFVCGKHDQGHGHGGAANEHPTQKPLRLMNELVALFSQPGGTVLDCFMGSGTTGVAALAMGRAFIGIEREPRYFDSACRRIEQAVAQRSLFKSVAPISSPAPSSKAQIAIPMEVPHS